MPSYDQYKQCKECKKMLPLSEFYKQVYKRWSDGYRPRCKKCYALQRRMYRGAKYKQHRASVEAAKGLREWVE